MDEECWRYLMIGVGSTAAPLIAALRFMAVRYFEKEKQLEDFVRETADRERTQRETFQRIVLDARNAPPD